MNTTKCNGCGFVVNTDPCQCNVIPPQYPYNRPARDSYTFCCCGGTTPPINQYPSAGPFVGSAFMMNDGDPFLMDSTQMTYGAVLSYSESVYTHISKRDDLSCINLTGVFDMTDTSLTNTVRNDFLKQYISRKYMELSGVLPIVKTTMKFRIYYTIRDLYGGTLEQRHCDTNVTDSKFHFTDIRDRYVQSAKGLVIENIPAITYQGLYNITIDRIEIRMGVIDTKQHLVDAMNPFYQFTDNNQRITLQSETIKNTPQDSEIVVATCEVNKSFDYQANVTNRLRLTFTAFTSLPIACGDTMGIWNALNEPTDAVITQLRNEVTAMEEEIRLLHLKDQEQDDRITALENQVELNKNNISTLTARVTSLEAANRSKDEIINSILARLDALEAIHHALVHYETGKQFYMAQLTWRHHGELFQATRDFVASGSFDTDLANGNLTPVQAGEIDLSDIVARIDTVEQTANDADSTATAAATAVDAMASTVSGLSTSVETISGEVITMGETVGTLGETVATLDGTVASHTESISTINGDISDLDTRVSDLEEKDLSKNKLVVKNLDTKVNQYVESWSAAADILKADNDGAYKIYPGEGFEGTEIANELFKNVASLKEIDFVQNTTIGNKAFYQSGLTSLTLDGKINSVGSEICYKCLSLTTLVINKATLDIGAAAFSGCTNLTNVSLPAVDRLETSAFYNIGATTLSVPHYCGYINTGCFNKCENLTSITINAESIADHIFNSSTNLQTVELLENVRYINSSCFEGCPTPLTVNIHRSEGSITGAPWGAGAGVTINWGVN